MSQSDFARGYEDGLKKRPVQDTSGFLTGPYVTGYRLAQDHQTFRILVVGVVGALAVFALPLVAFLGTGVH